MVILVRAGIIPVYRRPDGVSVIRVQYRAHCFDRRNTYSTVMEFLNGWSGWWQYHSGISCRTLSPHGGIQGKYHKFEFYRLSCARQLSIDI